MMLLFVNKPHEATEIASLPNGSSSLSKVNSAVKAVNKTTRCNRAVAGEIANAFIEYFNSNSNFNLIFK